MDPPPTPTTPAASAAPPIAHFLVGLALHLAIQELLHQTPGRTSGGPGGGGEGNPFNSAQENHLQEGRVWVKDMFGLGAVGVANYVLNCDGQARFTGAVQFVGTDNAISLNNGSFLNFNNNGSIRRYTPDATEGLYMAHNNFVAVSVGDVSTFSNPYFMCDGAVSKPYSINQLMC